MSQFELIDAHTGSARDNIGYGGRVSVQHRYMVAISSSVPRRVLCKITTDSDCIPYGSSHIETGQVSLAHIAFYCINLGKMGWVNIR